jgi:GNAT superfamily N-acetyltransferase
LVEDGLVWAALDDDEQLVGLAYSRFSEEDQEWEIGGLMVLERVRGRGIGAILMVLTLGHLLFNEDPLSLDPRPTVLAHVLKRNQMPRGIITNALKFHLAREVVIPGDVLPGLPVEEDGCVHGDEFHISLPETLRSLSAFADSWQGVLSNGELAVIEMFEGTDLSLWADAFDEMAAGF